MPCKEATDRNRIKMSYKLRVRGELKMKVLAYLEAHPCVDCGEDDPVVLEFDHVRDKVRSIANLVNDCVPWERIVDEMAKCEVRCANCHKRKTARQLGYWKQLA